MHTSPQIVNPTILLVEDDARLSALIQEYLEKENMTVMIESRGDLASKKIIDEQPDLAKMAASASITAKLLAIWPDDIDEKWWHAEVANSMSDPVRIGMLASIASQGGSNVRTATWSASQVFQPTWWRMVGGRQQWLRTMREAAEDSGWSGCSGSEATANSC